MAIRIDGEPYPRERPLDYAPYKWRVSRTLRLGAPVLPQDLPFTAVAESRRSVRRIAKAPLRETVNLLRYVQATRVPAASGPIARERRLAASAGGLHPVDLLLVTSKAAPRVLRVDPPTESLQQLAVVDPVQLRTALAAALTLLPEAEADLILFAADLAKTHAVYGRADSLAWRDAGCLLQTMHLCATAFRMAFCPLGLEGHELLKAVSGSDRLIPAGLALVGRLRAG